MALEVAGLELALALPDGAQPTEPSAVDLSVAPGASLVQTRAWAARGHEVQLVCVAGDAWFWSPGLEAPTLDAASALTRKTLALPSLVTTGVRPGPPFEQSYSGDGVTGRHWLGFAGDQVVVCSLSCRGDGGSCDQLVEGASMSSEAVPAPGPVLAAATSLAARPQATALGVVAVAVLGAALILWRRPRTE
jgi:hypothetical protein